MMGFSKGSKGTVCPIDDNSVFIIRKHGSGRNSQTPGLSRQTSVKSYQSKTSRLTLDEDLKTLEEANIIFLRRVEEKQEAEKLDNVPNKYIIVNTCGEMMFYALEVTDPITRETFKEEDQPIKFAVVNTQGEEVFDIEGRLKGIDAYVTVKRDNVVLGNVAQINKLSSCCRKVAPSYLIKAPDGRTLQKIRGQDTWKSLTLGCLSVNDFNVYSPDGSICKAKISRQTNAISLEEYSEADTYALSFHTTDMDGKVKALLLAAVLMLDFQLFETKSKSPWDYKSIVYRGLICIIFLLLLLGGIVLVIMTSLDFQDEKKTRFPGQIPT